MNALPATSEPAFGAPPSSTWADWAGMVASIGCAIHCAAMPLVLAYLPALGLTWLADEGFHKWMAAICFVLAAAAFVPGWRKHRSFLPAIWGATGLLLLTMAAFGLEGGCCAACSTDSSSAVATQSCSDDACSLCRATTSVESVPDSKLARLVPFITPMGGVLLVIGHLANHRKSCGCQAGQCCLKTKEMERDQ